MSPMASVRAGRGPARPFRSTARWTAAGVAAAATVAGGLVAAPLAVAAAAPAAVPCSVVALRHTITNAPANAVLVLKSGCAYRLTAALPTITRNLSIKGSGDTITAVSGGPYTILTNDGAVVSVSQTTFADGAGASYNPGAILNRNGGSLSLSCDTFLDNSGGTGGAVLNHTGGTLKVAGSTFRGNSATFLGGGAIANGPAGTATISNTKFLDNKVVNYSVGVKSAAADGSNRPSTDSTGGAISSLGGTVTVKDAAFTGNFADGAGGAIHVAAGTLTVTRAAFDYNQAGADGGAVASFGAAATISRSGLTGNGSGGGEGGAVADSGVLNLTRDTLSSNRALDGGGLYVEGGTVTLNATAVISNIVYPGAAGGIGVGFEGGMVTFLNGSRVQFNQPQNCWNLACPA